LHLYNNLHMDCQKKFWLSASRTFLETIVISLQEAINTCYNFGGHWNIVLPATLKWLDHAVLVVQNIKLSDS